MSVLQRTTSARNTIVLIILFICTEILGSKYAGPLSLRNYAVVFMLMYICVNRKKVVYDLKIGRIMRPLVGYYIFVAVLGTVNGLYSSSIGFDFILARFLPSLIIVAFLMTYVDNYSKLRCFITSLIVVLLLDDIVTILQGINSPIGWFIAKSFTSADTIDLIDSNEFNSSIGHSIATGFYGSVVGNGYLIGTLGMLFILPVVWKPSKGSSILSFIIFISNFFALFYCQQRMAFYVYLLGSVTAFFYYLFKRKNISKVILILILFSFALLFGLLDQLSNVDAGRLLDFQDEGRDDLRLYFWNDFLPQNILLGNRALFVDLRETTPHSLIIETLLLGGIIGLIIFGLFLVRLIRTILKFSFKQDGMEITLLSVPCVAFVLISIEHSSGFHTGMTLAMYVLVIVFLSIQYCNNENSITN